MSAARKAAILAQVEKIEVLSAGPGYRRYGLGEFRAEVARRSRSTWRWRVWSTDGINREGGECRRFVTARLHAWWALAEHTVE